MELSTLPFLMLIILAPLLIAYFIFAITHSSKNQPHRTGFKLYPIVGSLPQLLLNRHRFLDWTTGILRDTPTNSAVFHRPGKVHGVLTANPANVEHILKSNFHNYPKGPRFISFLEDFLGRGIFNSDGDLWKVQRKTASYEFNTKSLRNFVLDNVRTETSTRLIPLLERASREGQGLDLQDVLERFAFDNICKLAFDVDPGCLAGDTSAGTEFMRAFDNAATLSSQRFLSAFVFIWKIKRKLNLGTERKLRESVEIVRNYADDIINARLEAQSENKNEDLLSRFIASERNSAEFLRDIVVSFILAGRDTTSSALSWFFWLLSLSPPVEENILTELRAIRERNGKRIGDAFSFEELQDMHYLHAAISETLRLYPPVPVDTKMCLQDDTLPDGTFVGKGWFVSYHTYAMGRTERLWGNDWNRFRPERWIKDRVYQPESPFRFPVFHGGPRMCLGKDMAYLQMKSIAASVIERFVIDVPTKDEHPRHLLSLTLRMKGGLPVNVRER